MRNPNDNRDTRAAQAARAVRETVRAVTEQRAQEPERDPAAPIPLTPTVAYTPDVAARIEQTDRAPLSGLTTAAPPAGTYTDNLMRDTAAHKLRALGHTLDDPNTIRDVLAPAVLEMFGHLSDNPLEREKRLALALLILAEKGDDWVADLAPLGSVRELVKFAVDNPWTDAQEARLTGEAARIISHAIFLTYSAVRPVVDRMRDILLRDALGGQ